MARHLKELPVRQLWWDSTNPEWEESQVLIRQILTEDILGGKPMTKGDVRVLFLPRIEDFKGADGISEKLSEVFHIDPVFWTTCETGVYFQGNAFPFNTQYQGSEDWTMNRGEEGTEDKYRQHSLAFFSLWLSEADRVSFSQFLLCFGLSDDMKSSIVEGFKKSDGLIVSGGPFEVYGVRAKMITDYAAEATPRLERAVCDIQEKQSPTLNLKGQPTINAPVPEEDPERRYRQLLHKFEDMCELSRKLIQAREFLAATETTLSSIDRYANNFMTRWSPYAQEDIGERIGNFKQFGKTTHKIEKMAGSYKRQLDNEIRLVHQLISTDNVVASGL